MSPLAFTPRQPKAEPIEAHGLNTIIFYLSTNPAPDRQRFQITADKFVYIRVEILSASIDDETAAYDLASPRDDETVMNAHTL